MLTEKTEWILQLNLLTHLSKYANQAIAELISAEPYMTEKGLSVLPHTQ